MPAGPVLSVAEALALEQLRHRHFVHGTVLGSPVQVDGQALGPRTPPPELGQHGRAAATEPAGRFAALVQQGLGSDLATAVCQLEKDVIALGLRETRGNKSRLAARLGVSRTTLIKKIREYGLEQTDPGQTNPGIDE